MSDLQMKSWHIENLYEAEPDCQVVIYKEAAEIVQQQQARISELENQEKAWSETVERLRIGNAEMSATVERLRAGVNDAIEALVAETSESGSVDDGEIHDLRTLELVTPATNLNAVKRKSYQQGFCDGACYSARVELPDQVTVMGAEQRANQRYPDKE